MSDDWDRGAIFDADYLHFYADFLDDARSDADTEIVTRVLGLRPGDEVLDLACGHGRIANRLAGRGIRVTGLDESDAFLHAARADAAARGVVVDYRHGDMRDLTWPAQFDAVVCWFSSFGYFDDAANRAVLAGACRALRPGGRLLVELLQRDAVLPIDRHVTQATTAEGTMSDETVYEPATFRAVTVRTIRRGRWTRRASYSMRLFAAAELCQWMLDAGFATAEAFRGDGEALSPDSRRMIVLARTAP